MFGKKNADPQNATRRAATVDTLISQRTHISGDVTFSGGLHVDGSVRGNLNANSPDATITLTEHGRIEGDIRAPFVVINGELNGDVYASERLELAPKARISGNVHYKLMEMQAGAQVNGSMRQLVAAEEIKALAAPIAELEGQISPA